MKNILKLKAIGVLTLLLMFSCSPDEEITKEVDPIKAENLGENLNLVVGSEVSFNLSGGNGTYTLKVEGEDIVDAKIEGKKLIVVANKKGKAQVTIVSEGKFLTTNVNVIDAGTGVFEGDTIKLGAMATVQNVKGTWLLEKQNPYAGKRLFISVKKDEALTVGQSLEVEINSNVDGVKNGKQNVTVEFLSVDVAGIKVGNYLVKIPRK